MDLQSLKSQETLLFFFKQNVIGIYFQPPSPPRPDVLTVRLLFDSWRNIFDPSWYRCQR